MVRAKFVVREIKRFSTNVNGTQKELQTIVLNPVYSTEAESENGKFYAYTPAGKIELGTVNAEAAKEFALDQEFFVDFTPVG